MLVVKKERVDNLGLNPISQHGPGEAMIEHIYLYQHVPYTNYTKTQVWIKGNLMLWNILNEKLKPVVDKLIYIASNLLHSHC